MKKFKNKIARIKNLVSIYYHLVTKLTLKKTNGARIVICFDGSTSHGGLLDRIKGIISFYAIAKEKGIPFFIYFEHPFSLLDFLVEKDYNWFLSKQTFNPLKDKVLYLMNDFASSPLEQIDSNFKGTYWVYANVDYLAKIYSLNSSDELSKRWADLYDELFVPSTYLAAALAQLPQEKHIVCHTRFTTLMGDFKDTTSLILTKDAQNELIEKIKVSLNIVKTNHINLPIYVLSDSIRFLTQIELEGQYKVLPGLPQHIDVTSASTGLEAHLKTFTDFYFITQSESVYLLHISPMYNSAFSKYAAIVGRKPFFKLS